MYIAWLSINVIVIHFNVSLYCYSLMLINIILIYTLYQFNIELVYFVIFVIQSLKLQIYQAYIESYMYLLNKCLCTNKMAPISTLCYIIKLLLCVSLLLQFIFIIHFYSIKWCTIIQHVLTGIFFLISCKAIFLFFSLLRVPHPLRSTLEREKTQLVF